MNLLSFLLFAPTATAEGGKPAGGGWQMLIFIILMLAIFYLFLIRPQKKRQKEEQKKRDELKKGDRIITIGGLHGKICEVQDTTFTIEVEDGTKIRIEKTAVNTAIEPAAK